MPRAALDCQDPAAAGGTGAGLPWSTPRPSAEVAVLLWLRHTVHLSLSLLLAVASFLVIPLTEQLHWLLPDDPEIRVVRVPDPRRHRVPRFDDEGLERALDAGLRGSHASSTRDQLRLWYHKERARRLPHQQDPAPRAEPWPAVDRLMAMGWPVPERYPVGSGFGFRVHPILGMRSFHTGSDIGMPVGTEIYAVLPGRVGCACQDPVSGRYVVLEHGDALASVYCHASELLVRTGERVEAGQAIALVGSTGRSTGPHLHFGLRIAGTWIDPVLVHRLQGAARFAPAEPSAAPSVGPREPSGSLPPGL
jgi:hypothetical protein